MKNDNSINLIIYSKDRPMQLDCLLRSIEKNASFFDICIIYKPTNIKFDESYSILPHEHKDCIFILEEDLKINTIDWLHFEYTCFAMDDDIFFKKIEHIPTLNEKETYSLRLGGNIKNKLHFDYTFSLDGNVFRTDDIKPLIKQIEFNNPNDLEKRLQQFKEGWKLKYDSQRLVGVPHNRVSEGSHCFKTDKYPIDSLNDRFLNGERIDFKKMDFSNITDVHKDIDYVFKEL